MSTEMIAWGLLIGFGFILLVLFWPRPIKNPSGRLASTRNGRKHQP